MKLKSTSNVVYIFLHIFHNYLFYLFSMYLFLFITELFNYCLILIDLNLFNFGYSNFIFYLISVIALKIYVLIFFIDLISLYT